MINYKMFKSPKQNNSGNCQSCEQNKTTNRINQMNTNMNQIINSQKNIPNVNSLPKNIQFNNKITIEYFNNNTKACPNC